MSEPTRQTPRVDSAERWRALIESAVDGIVVIDGRGRIEAFNRSAERLFGYREADVVGHNVSMLMPSPYRDEHDGYLARYHASGVPHIIGVGREVEGRHQDGTIFPIHLSVGEMHVDGARKFTGILHDLRPRLRLEERLREQATMARLGEMAAVVAHEVKNPLAAIRGAIQVLSARMPAGSGDADVAGQVVERIDGLAALVDDLLVFARPPQPKPARVDLMALVASAAEWLARDPALAGVRFTCHGERGEVIADPEQLRIVVGNLLVNSAQAMQGRGDVDVSVVQDAGVTRLRIRDHGPGVPPEILPKVFTPFFTTKARGSGLGLPTARQLVEAQGGTIELACPDGGGTVVTVTLPSAVPGGPGTPGHGGQKG